MLVRIADPYSDLDNCESRKGDGGLLVTRRSLGGNGILDVGEGNGLNLATWPNMVVVVQIPRAMPLAMLYMALGQKTLGCFALPGTALYMAFGHGFVRQRRWSI
jgi:hypothetical protein